MNRAILAISVAAVIAGLLPVSARAQYQISDRSRVGISLSFMRPSGSQLRNMSDTWLGPSLFANLTFDEKDRATSSIGISWYGQEGGDTKANIIPLTGTYIKRFGKDDDSPWYAGGGLGAYFVNYKGFVLSPAGYTLQSDNEVRYGMHLVFGREFGGWFAEIRRDFVSSLTRSNGEDIDLGGWAISFGSRLAL